MTGTNVRVLRIALARSSASASLCKRKDFAAGIVRNIGSRDHRTPSHADELCRRRTTFGRRGGCGGGSWRCCGSRVVAAPVVVAPVCAQVVNVYGQITTVCR